MNRFAVSLATGIVCVILGAVSVILFQWGTTITIWLVLSRSLLRMALGFALGGQMRQQRVAERVRDLRRTLRVLVPRRDLQ